jgi:hypothetical protein
MPGEGEGGHCGNGREECFMGGRSVLWEGQSLNTGTASGIKRRWSTSKDDEEIYNKAFMYFYISKCVHITNKKNILLYIFSQKSF